jgi:hypothetical protein
MELVEFNAVLALSNVVTDIEGAQLKIACLLGSQVGLGEQ